MRTKVLILLLLAAAALNAPARVYARTIPPHNNATLATSAEKFYRTELYFGLSKPEGSIVTEAEWRAFLKDFVTPRFPDGFTELSARGQYRDKEGRIILEESRVLVFLYPRNAKKSGRAKIEEIRAAYVRQFSQESVLRLDFAQMVKVSF